MSRGFTVGKVNFSLRPTLTEYEELQMRSASAGLEWFEAVLLIQARITAECKVVADGVLADMATYVPEQWADAKQQFA